MKTGEGKTLVATLALYLNALEGRGAHLVTVNDYLARRDAGWMAALYHFLGLTVGVIAGQDQLLRLRPRVRRRDPSRPASAAPAAVHAARGVRGRHHVLDQQRARLRLSARQHGAEARPLRAAPVALRDRRRGRLDPHRRGAHAAHHQRPGERGDREVLHVRAAHPAARRGGRLHDRREDQVGVAHRGGRREDREVDRDLEHLRHGARRRGAPDQPGAEGARAVACATRTTS